MLSTITSVTSFSATSTIDNQPIANFSATSSELNWGTNVNILNQALYKENKKAVDADYDEFRAYVEQEA